MSIVYKDPLGYRLKSLTERSIELGISVYQVRKQTQEMLEAGIISRWGNSFYLTEKGLNLGLEKP